MSLDKAVEHNKEHRKPYRGAKAIDTSCRNHGGCDWCKSNRLYSATRRQRAMDYDEDDWENDWDDEEEILNV